DSPTLADRFAGVASGELTLKAHGLERKDLLDSLEGSGSLRVLDAELPPVDWTSAAAQNNADARPRIERRFGAASAAFHISAGNIRVDQLSLPAGNQRLDITGNVDFAQHLDLHVRSVASNEPANPPIAADTDPSGWA